MARRAGSARGGAEAAETLLPSVSRRREVAGGSARSLLMTTLGEFVLPFGQPVWTASLVHALGLLGIEQGSARQVLARTAAEGWLSSERVGRRVRWSVSDSGRRLLAEGADRIYSFGSGVRSWDGRWLIVMISIPESMRALRHKLRTRLSWAGFGSPSPGLWISPHVAATAEAKRVLDDLDVSTTAWSFVAEYGTIGSSQQEMVDAAWNLADIAQRYQAFIDDFGALAPQTADEVFVAQIRLVHAWRRFPFLDPQLPKILLPPHWSGITATRLFAEQHTQWREPARRRWSELATTG